VDSCIVRLRNRAAPYAEDVPTPFLMRLIRAAFSQRRKTLRNALVKSGAFGAPAEAVLAAFEEADIDPGRRAETLSLADYAALAKGVHRRVAPNRGDQAS
jgi:16S rRNA (adenine1518-N6/adenine1519-N6)-dimethyltransferase